jgi:hypothetical protein
MRIGPEYMVDRTPDEIPNVDVTAGESSNHRIEYGAKTKRK